MPDQQHRPAGARHAIELVTAWLDSADGPSDLLVDYLRCHLDEGTRPDGAGSCDGADQRPDLPQWLPAGHARARDRRRGVDILRRIALEYARD